MVAAALKSTENNNINQQAGNGNVSEEFQINHAMP